MKTVFPVNLSADFPRLIKYFKAVSLVINQNGRTEGVILPLE